MGKKEASGASGKRLGAGRPGQLIALLAVMGVSILASLYMWYLYAGVVGGNSLPVSAEALPMYRKVLLLNVALFLLVWVLLFLGKKAGFWMAAALYSMDLFSKITALNLTGILVTGLCLYFLFCQKTRLYFGVEPFKTSGLKKK